MKSSVLMITHFLNFFLFCLVFGEAVIFKVYDIDGKGKITFKDLLEVLRDLTGSFMSEEQREVLIYYFINFCISLGRFPFFRVRKIFWICGMTILLLFSSTNCHPSISDLSNGHHLF